MLGRQSLVFMVCSLCPTRGDGHDACICTKGKGNSSIVLGIKMEIKQVPDREYTELQARVSFPLLGRMFKARLLEAMTELQEEM